MSDPQSITQNNSPVIGVFDSGFGGLTVLRALVDRLPHARFAFIGDTARLPYGSKSRRTIARYAVESARFLVSEQGAEFLVIACNTASALALDAIQDAVSVPVLGVIEPGAAAARAASSTRDVLVIATDATVHSHAYASACSALGLRALEKACPLLVPLVEEGWIDPPALAAAVTGSHAAETASVPAQVAVTEQVIRIYLEELLCEAAAQGSRPDTLVLGCTHYPLLRPLIERAVPAGMKVIDSAESTAAAAVHLINGRNGTSKDGSGSPGGASLIATTARVTESSRTDPGPGGGGIRCFATDSVEKFERLGSRFLGRPVGKVELVDLGG
jgi:glutamate racemase